MYRQEPIKCSLGNAMYYLSTGQVQSVMDVYICLTKGGALKLIAAWILTFYYVFVQTLV